MKSIVRIVVLLAALVAAGTCQAQTYPNRAVRVIVPFAPGGVTDVMARLLAQKLSENLGQQFYVDNHGGAGGNIGTAIAAAAPADGYTLVLTSSSYVVNPGLHAKIPYDPEKDLVPITVSAVSPNALVVNPEVPAKTVDELIAYIRSMGEFKNQNEGEAQ